MLIDTPRDFLQNAIKKQNRLTITVFTSKFEIKLYYHALLNDTIK